ncbi:MAG: hypothetical protein ACXVCY_14925, partial [Pseudobdellovibrionaceae bacterium]
MKNHFFKMGSFLRKSRPVLVVIGISALALSYQNCSSGSHSSPAASTTPTTSTTSTTGANTLGAQNACSFNGLSVADGASVVAYQNASPLAGQSCVKETRVCSNGALSGSYSFATCNENGPADCTFNGKTVSNGASISAFATSTVAAGSNCASQSRVCTNGVLSGSYTYASCTPGAPAGCLFNGVQLKDGDTVKAFKDSSVAANALCEQETRTCSNGSLSGSYAFASCGQNAKKSCQFNNQTYADGQAVIAFSTSTVASGSTCQSEQRICSDGTLSGSYTFASCQPGAAASCLFSVDGATVVSGGTIRAYSTTSVPNGQTCAYQDRKCNNGVLDGSYTNVSCMVEPAAGTCASGSATVVSPDNSNYCQIEWPSASSGKSVTGTSTNGGFLNGVCQANGSWSYNYSCPNKTGVVCAAGSTTVTSPDNATSCVLTWGSASAGKSITGTASNGGAVSATCDASGGWSASYNCPNKSGLTCAGGIWIQKSPDGSKTCTLYWPIGSPGQSVTGSATNGGSISGVCQADGSW